MVLGEDWREAFIHFIREQRLPVGIDARSAEAARVMRRSKGFVLVDTKLYRRGARSGVLMKCATKVLSIETHRRVTTGNTRSREAPGTAGGPRSLGQRPSNPAHTLAWSR
jgi:hypothetical protein